MVANSKNKQCGRPPGKKDPNRKRILNSNGRIIDVDGPQYNKLLRSGYNESEDGKTLVFNESYIRKTIPRGRPKKIRVINPHGKVVNPDTKRLIKTDNVTFKTLSKKYYYNKEKNEFYKFVNHPKKPDIKLDVTGKEVKKYMNRGYIFDKENNTIIIPGKKTESAFQKRLFDYDLTIMNELDPTIQMSLLNRRIERMINKSLQIHKGITFGIYMTIEFKKHIDEQQFTFGPKFMTITSREQIPNTILTMNNDIKKRIDEYTDKGSGWLISKVIRHFISINKYSPLSARSYIKLPDKIQNTRAVINIQNKDDKCFIYCLGRALDPNPEKDNLYRVSKHLKKVCVELGLDKIKMPVTIKDVPKVEKLLNININVFGHSYDGSIYPIICKDSEKKTVNLLITSNEETNHYVLKKDFNKLCNKIIKNGYCKYFCMNCIQHFPSQDRLEKHKPDCMKMNDVQAVDLPQNGINNFYQIENTLDVPWVIYADSESLLVPLPTDVNNMSQTNKTHKHVACSFGFKVVCVYDDKLSESYRSFRGENCVEDFLNALFEVEKRVADKLKYGRYVNVKNMIITEEQKKVCKRARKCYLCKERFTEKNYKVKDHCHMTGLFRGAACNTCNLKLKLSHKIPVIFHNLRGYDSHLLLEKLGKFKRPINIIFLSKYMMFSVGSEIKYFDKKIGVEKTSVIHRLTFIDSLQFMPNSLSSLVDNLKSSGLDKFKYLNQEFKNDSEILTRKGIYPYNFLDDWTKFDVECKDLKIEDFKNDLTGENISEKDFQFFSNTYQQLNIKTLGEYHDLYLKTDVLLLAD